MTRNIGVNPLTDTKGSRIQTQLRYTEDGG